MDAIDKEHNCSYNIFAAFGTQKEAKVMSTVVSSMDLRRRIGEILARIVYAGERFIIKQRGQPVAALISIHDLQLLEKMEEQRDIQILRLARETSEHLIPFEELVAQYERLYGEKLELTSAETAGALQTSG